MGLDPIGNRKYYFSGHRDVMDQFPEDAGPDLVAVWEVHLADGVHMIEFEHGTTSGKRLVRVNKEEVVRKEWMFKLVGNESFHVGKSKTVCVIKIEPVGGFTYQYTLEVSGVQLQ